MNDEERQAVQDAESARRDASALHDIGLDYNLACYFVMSRQTARAIPIFRTLRALHPTITSIVLSDPDLAEATEILELFRAEPHAAASSGAPALGPSGMPSPPQSPANRRPRPPNDTT